MTATIKAGYTKGHTRYKITQSWHGTHYRLRHNKNGFTSNSTIYRREQLTIHNSLECRPRIHTSFKRKPLTRERIAQHEV
jgi:hypothetical protein